MQYSIRPMESTDIAEVFEIDKASAVLELDNAEIRLDGRERIIRDDPEGKILGFIVFWLIIDEAHLANFAVRSEARCMGIGRALLDHGLRTCYEGGARVSFLEVRAGNAPAIHLYESTGYHTESIRRQYYQDNHEDALLMNLDREDYEKRMKEGQNE